MPTVSKSIRLEESLAQQLSDVKNFSDFCNSAIREKLIQEVWIANTSIHEYAKIESNQLLQRLKNVKYLRVSDNDLSFKLSPIDKGELESNRRIHAYANGSFNDIHDGKVYFNVKFPQDFYFFLRSNSWADVQKMIKGYLAFKYLLYPDERREIELNTESNLFKQIKKIYMDQLIDLESLFNDSVDFRGKDKMKLKLRFSDKYFDLLLKNNITPIIFPYVKDILMINYPYNLRSNLISKRNQYWTIKLEAAYMRNLYDEKDDWQSIVISKNESSDDLCRAESSKYPFGYWKNQYQYWNACYDV